MTNSKGLLEEVKSHFCCFVTGVPDSGIKEDLNNIESLHKVKHHTAVDEGEAIGLAVGHYTATKSVPFVYMQSDGLCNALNAITSLVIPYKIPMHIFISMRRKHPQHEVMGRLTYSIILHLERECLTMGHSHLTFHIYDKGKSNK